MDDTDLIQLLEELNGLVTAPGIHEDQQRTIRKAIAVIQGYAVAWSNQASDTETSVHDIIATSFDATALQLQSEQNIEEGEA